MKVSRSAKFISYTSFKIASVCLLATLACNAFFTFKNKSHHKGTLKLPSPYPVLYHFANITLPPKEFLIWNENCRIPRLEVLPSKNIDYDLAYKATNCSPNDFFISKYFDDKTKSYRLKFQNDYSCCYREVIYDSKNRVRSSSCYDINNSFKVLHSYKFGIIVECDGEDESIYEEAHFFFPPNEHKTEDSIETAENKFNAKLNDFDIYLIGVNGLSQLSLPTKIPQTFDYFKRKGWFQLSGYNKAQDHALTNLMAMLTGLNSSKIQERCKGYDNDGFLDECHLLFERLQTYGFSIAYAEDEASSVGFENSPIDFYLTPMLTELKNQARINDCNEKSECIGSRRATDLIYDAATEFMLLSSKKSKFGIFSTNSILFDDSVGPSDFDERMLAYMKKWELNGIFENNVFIFLSDHGLHCRTWPKEIERYYEDRLPAFFIYLPPFMRQKYPEFAYALTVNRHRLTSPYDMYMTLQHIVSISQAPNNIISASILPAESCPTCQTVLEPIADNRSCVEAGLTPAWCACESFFKLNISNMEDIISDITRLVVQKMNNFHLKHEPYQCRKLFLKSVDHVGIKANNFVYNRKQHEQLNFTTLDAKREGVWLHVRFTTTPGEMKYASTFLYFEQAHQIELDIYDSISIETFHENWSNCVQNVFVKRFCYCY